MVWVVLGRTTRIYFNGISCNYPVLKKKKQNRNKLAQGYPAAGPKVLVSPPQTHLGVTTKQIEIQTPHLLKKIA